jgi:hypothetical protein
MSNPPSRSPLFLALALLTSIGALFMLIRQKPQVDAVTAAEGKLYPQRLAQVDALLLRDDTSAALSRISAANEDSHPEFLASRVRCLIETDRRDEALAWLEKEKAHPYHPALLHARVQLQLSLKDLAGVERSAALLRLTQPSDCRTFAVEALRACLKGDSVAAMKLLEILRQVAGAELAAALPPTFRQAFRVIPSFTAWEKTHLAVAAP